MRYAISSSLDSFLFIRKRGLATTWKSTFVNLQMHVLQRPLEGILRLSDATVVVGVKAAVIRGTVHSL